MTAGRQLAATKVAFAFTGEGSEWVGMGQALYESEPVVAGGAGSLRRGSAGRTECFAVGCDVWPDAIRRALWTIRRGRSQPLYALECALGGVVGERGDSAERGGRGRVSGSLRQRRRRGCLVWRKACGLQWRGAQKGLWTGIAVVSPALTLVSSMTGKVVESGDALDEAYWQRQASESVAFDRCVETLAELDVQVVVEIGPDAVLGPKVASAWPESADGAGVSVVLVEYAAGLAGGRRLRGGGCRRVRGGAGGCLCGVVRWGDAVPNLAAELSVPAPPSLDRSAARSKRGALSSRLCCLL